MPPRLAQSQRRVRTPNCTHIDMGRYHTREEHCYVCGHTPSLGFLYVCHQDVNAAELDRPVDADGGVSLKPALQQELEAIGLSEWMIGAALRGEYTPAHLEKLKAQKLELNQIIEGAIQGRQIQAAQAQLDAMDSLSKGLSLTEGTHGSKPYKYLTPPCTFKACHTCRPYYKDRIYGSIEEVFSGTVPAITPAEAARLPVYAAQIVRTMGLRSPPSPPERSPGFPKTMTTSTDFSTDWSASLDREPSRSSVLTFKTTQTDVDEINAFRRPRKRFYKLGSRSSGSITRDLSTLPMFFRSGLKAAIQGIFRSGRESSSEGSNITLPHRRTGTARDLTAGEDGDPIGEFDVGSLRRVRRLKERADLANGTYVTGYQGVGESSQTPYRGRVNVSPEDSEESDFSVYSCLSEGSEVEVTDGVALTEEAVGTHTPDMIRSSSGTELQMMGMKISGRALDRGNMENGSENIMTQA